MNTDQLNSLIRSVMKIAAGLLAAHGLQDAATWLNTPDVISALLLFVSLLWSHFEHATISPPPTSGGASTSGGAALSTALLVAGFFLLTGCQSTPQSLAYKTVGTTIVTGDTAMNLWGAYVAANHPGTNAEAQVKSAYTKYQAAMELVCDAGEIYSANGTNTTGAAMLDEAVSNAGQDLLDLENLLTQAGVNLTQ